MIKLMKDYSGSTNHFKGMFSPWCEGVKELLRRWLKIVDESKVMKTSEQNEKWNKVTSFFWLPQLLLPLQTWNSNSPQQQILQLVFGHCSGGPG